MKYILLILKSNRFSVFLSDLLFFQLKKMPKSFSGLLGSNKKKLVFKFSDLVFFLGDL